MAFDILHSLKKPCAKIKLTLSFLQLQYFFYITNFNFCKQRYIKIKSKYLFRDTFVLKYQKKLFFINSSKITRPTEIFFTMSGSQKPFLVVLLVTRSGPSTNKVSILLLKISKLSLLKNLGFVYFQKLKKNFLEC